MKLHRIIPAIALGIFLGCAQAQDILTQALDTDLAAEWNASFLSCARALKYHGEGKDDRALAVLSANAPNEPAKEHYKLAVSKPKDAFWAQVAKAGAHPAGAPPIDCQADLSARLDLHFGGAPKAFGKADDDAATNSFLALSDLLLSIPPLGFGGVPHDTVANTYRFCFSDPDGLFAMVKSKLGRVP